MKEGERYKKIGLDFAAVDRLLGELFLQADGEMGILHSTCL